MTRYLEELNRLEFLPHELMVQRASYAGVTVTANGGRTFLIEHTPSGNHLPNTVNTITIPYDGPETADEAVVSRFAEWGVPIDPADLYVFGGLQSIAPHPSNPDIARDERRTFFGIDLPATAVKDVLRGNRYADTISYGELLIAPERRFFVPFIQKVFIAHYFAINYPGDPGLGPIHNPQERILDLTTQEMVEYYVKHQWDYRQSLSRRVYDLHTSDS